jgi:hypothetical protein
MVLTRQVMEVVEGEREAGLLSQTVSVELRKIGWVKRME